MLNWVEVGDLVKGNDKADIEYSKTDSEMTVGEVTRVDEKTNRFEVLIKEHTYQPYVGLKYGGLDPRCFDYADGYTPKHITDDCAGGVISSLL